MGGRTMCGRPAAAGEFGVFGIVATVPDPESNVAAGALAAQIRGADGSDPAALDRCMEAVRLRACRFG